MSVIYDTVQGLLMDNMLAENPREPSVVIFSAKGYPLAMCEQSALAAFHMGSGAPTTYMGIPYRVDHRQTDLVTVQFQ